VFGEVIRHIIKNIETDFFTDSLRINFLEDKFKEKKEKIIEYLTDKDFYSV